MLGLSAVLVREALPLFREVLAERLPFEPERDVVGEFAYSVVETPDIAAPDSLELSLTVLMSPRGVFLGQEAVEVGRLGRRVRDLVRQFEELHNAANDSGARLSPIILAHRDSTPSEFQQLIEQLAAEVSVVQLGFLRSTVIERPRLGTVRTRSESGVTLSLAPQPGTSPVEFREDDTYDDFDRRAVEIRKRGPFTSSCPEPMAFSFLRVGTSGLPTTSEPTPALEQTVDGPEERAQRRGRSPLPSAQFHALSPPTLATPVRT
jgi:hypothetical protein